MINRNEGSGEHVGARRRGGAPATLTAATPVGQWVAKYPSTAEIFEMFDVDYCCRGDQSLQQTCWDRGLEVIRVHSLLKSCIAEIDDATMENWLHAPLADLCDDIERVHHDYLKHELPSLTSLIAEVVALYGDDHAELEVVRQQYQIWRDEVLAEIAEEEHSLFPAIRKLASKETLMDVHAGAITKMVRDVSMEHRDIGAALRNVRRASGGFAKPPDACPKYAQMLGLLRRIETNVRHYVHKEECILFPRAVAMVDSTREL